VVLPFFLNVNNQPYPPGRDRFPLPTVLLSRTAKNLAKVNVKWLKKVWFVITSSPEQRQTSIGKV
jgi:hypothetical protein